MIHLKIAGVDFDAGHFISWHPKCGRVHGHTYNVEVTIGGEINPKTGMLIDFGIIKPFVRTVAEFYDHKMIVNKKDTRSFSEDKVSVSMRSAARDRLMVLPKDEVVVIDGDATVENIAADFVRQLSVMLKGIPNLTLLSVYVSEGNAKGAEVTWSIGGAPFEVPRAEDLQVVAQTVLPGIED